MRYKFATAATGPCDGLSHKTDATRGHSIVRKYVIPSVDNNNKHLALQKSQLISKLVQDPWYTFRGL